jgi:uncharacterized protein (DUF697 family)
MKKVVDFPGSIGTVRNFVSVLREISFDEVRDQAETIPRLLILAPTTAAARDLGLRLTGPAGELAITARELLNPPADLDRFDAIVVHDPALTGASRTIRDRLLTMGAAATVHVFDDRLVATDLALEQLRQAIVRAAPDRAPAFGRAFPVFRPAAARAVINETSLANAQFALISNIPAVIPVFGGIAAASADFIVLTKNQVMMMFKLGAMYGRDVHDQVEIIKELAPVVGAGFIWRSLARGAASFLPFAAGTLPKVGIAYAGTMAIGLAAEYYYRTELRPTREQLRVFKNHAVDVVRRIPLPVLQQKLGASTNVIEVKGTAQPGASQPPPVVYLPPPESTATDTDESTTGSAV